MKCNDIQDNLSFYIDKELESEEMVEITEHLANCDSCDKIYLDLLHMTGLLNDVEEVSLPKSFELSLKEELRKERRINRKMAFNWRYASSIAAVFLIGIFTLAMFNDMLNIIPDKSSYELSDQVAEPKENRKLKEASEPNEEIQSDDSQENAVALGEPFAIENGALSDIPEVEVKERASDSQRSLVQDEPVLLEAIENGASDKQLYNIQEVEEDSEEQFTVSRCSQALSSNSAAVKYFTNLIEERLAGFDYQLYGCSYENGEWHFSAIIFKDPEGHTYNEEVLIIGKNGEIFFEYESDIVGL